MNFSISEQQVQHMMIPSRCEFDRFSFSFVRPLSILCPHQCVPNLLSKSTLYVLLRLANKSSCTTTRFCSGKGKKKKQSCQHNKVYVASKTQSVTIDGRVTAFVGINFFSHVRCSSRPILVAIGFLHLGYLPWFPAAMTNFVLLQ